MGRGRNTVRVDHVSERPSLCECVRQVVAELHLRASQTNEWGQIEPPYTAPALLAMADDLQHALDAEARAE
jgi:hypothetical protein